MTERDVQSVITMLASIRAELAALRVDVQNVNQKVDAVIQRKVRRRKRRRDKRRERADSFERWPMDDTRDDRRATIRSPLYK
jgi:hypothetical protein